MVIQKWTAKMKPMQRPEFIETLKELNHVYRKHGRVIWSRVHNELYGGHVIFMERDFPDIQTLDTDETHSLEPDIFETKVRLLESVVPGSVVVTHYHAVDME